MINQPGLKPPRLISLKRYCQKRFSVETDPSRSNSIFYIEDFYKPDFIESIISNYYDTHERGQEEINQSSLKDLINEATRTF